MLNKLLIIYRYNSLLTKLHIWLRFNTCPFLEIEKLIPKEGIIIDYGCGHGIFSHILTLMSSKREIYSVDISERKILEAKKTIGRQNKRLNFLTNTKIDNLIEKADCIVIIDVLAYISNNEREELLRNIYNNLKQGAILIIKDIEKGVSLKYLFLYLQEFIMVKVFRVTEAKTLNFFNKNYLYNLLSDIGFDATISYMGKGYLYPHLSFICRRREC